MQTVAVPVIVAGKGFTVTIVVAAQEPIVYEMTDVPPVTPVTTPVALTIATAGVTLDQTPPSVGSLNVVVEPAQSIAVPVMADGVKFTVIIFVA